jgi:(1->4)-alpha-D-glucan 1-alpha-D-glucosylmutase
MMLSVSTHDTKRSADVRARIDVLSEVAVDWGNRVRHWHRWNRVHKVHNGRRAAPDRNTEYLYYQTLVGVWPLELGSREPAKRPAVTDEFRQRVESYMEKAVREGKQRSSWIEPNIVFEDALRRFVRRTLSPDTAGQFLTDLAEFVSRIARPGLWNSLARTAVHLTAPGTPDTYQGDELWNFSLVDPDNRRPVDFELRRQALTELSEAWSAGTGRQRRELARRLASSPEDGRIKMFIIWRTLEARRAEPRLFVGGAYEPIDAAGPAADHVFAFARRHGERAALTVVPRRVASLGNGTASPPTGAAAWPDTNLVLPGHLQNLRWTNAFTGTETDDRALAEIFSDLPVALLLAKA